MPHASRDSRPAAPPHDPCFKGGGLPHHQPQRLLRWWCPYPRSQAAASPPPHSRRGPQGLLPHRAWWARGVHGRYPAWRPMFPTRWPPSALDRGEVSPAVAEAFSLPEKAEPLPSAGGAFCRARRAMLLEFCSPHWVPLPSYQGGGSTHPARPYGPAVWYTITWCSNIIPLPPCYKGGGRCTPPGCVAQWDY